MELRLQLKTHFLQLKTSFTNKNRFPQKSMGKIKPVFFFLQIKMCFILLLFSQTFFYQSIYVKCVILKILHVYIMFIILENFLKKLLYFDISRKNLF